MNKTNPFLTKQYGEHWTGATTTEERILAARRFDAEQCAAALQVPGLQKGAKQAIERRQRQLAKA